jgi:hypothetical protein
MRRVAQSFRVPFARKLPYFAVGFLLVKPDYCRGVLTWGPFFFSTEYAAPTEGHPYRSGHDSTVTASDKLR